MPRSAPSAASASSAGLPPVDGHVHIVGIGAGGTGCWLQADSAWHRIESNFLCRVIGMDPATLKGDFDRLYVEHLLARLQASSLRAAVVLAQEQVHDSAGRVVPGVGLFHVPNDWCNALGKAKARERTRRTMRRGMGQLKQTCMKFV